MHELLSVFFFFFFTSDGGGGAICMRVYIGVGGMKVWVIAKISMSLGGVVAGGMCIRVYI